MFLAKGGEGLLSDRDNAGRTALHGAVHSADRGTFELLKKYNLSMMVNAPDRQGRTPLHVAAGDGAVDYYDALVRIGSVETLPDNEGITPAHMIR